MQFWFRIKIILLFFRFFANISQQVERRRITTANTKTETLTLDTEEIIVGVDISVDTTSNYIAAIRFHSVHAAASPWSLGEV